MGSGGLGALWAGAEPQPKSNLLPFSLKILHQVATISIIFNAMQTTNFKVKNIWGGNASPCLWLNPPMVRILLMSVSLQNGMHCSDTVYYRVKYWCDRRCRCWNCNFRRHHSCCRRCGRFYRHEEKVYHCQQRVSLSCILYYTRMWRASMRHCYVA